MFIDNPSSSSLSRENVTFSLMKALRHGPAYAKSTKSSRFVSAVTDGRCNLVQSGVAEVVVGSSSSPAAVSVRFENGEVLQDVDVILFCTGFKCPTFPFLDRDSIRGLNEHPCPSHKWCRMFDVDGDGDGGTAGKIAFVGFSRPVVGSIPPVAELQARLVTQVFGGRRRLPSGDAMRKQAAKDRVMAHEDFGRANPHGAWAALINWIPYMDGLAREVGCLPPSPLKLALLERQPVVAAALLFGPMCAFHYRLTTPPTPTAKTGTGRQQHTTTSSSSSDAAAVATRKKELATAVLKKLPWGARKRDTVFFTGLHMLCMLLMLE